MKARKEGSKEARKERWEQGMNEEVEGKME